MFQLRRKLLINSVYLRNHSLSLTKIHDLTRFRKLSTEEKNEQSKRTYITPDEKKQNELDQFAFAIESNPKTDGKISVNGWGDHGFLINDDFLKGSLILFPTFSLQWKNVKSLEDLTIDHFIIFKYATPRTELIILGTGEKLKFPKPELYKGGDSLTIPVLIEGLYPGLLKIAPVELMDSVNACTTFNMLSAEGRDVAAALISVPKNIK